MIGIHLSFTWFLYLHLLVINKRLLCSSDFKAVFFCYSQTTVGLYQRFCLQSCQSETFFHIGELETTPGPSWESKVTHTHQFINPYMWSITNNQNTCSSTPRRRSGLWASEPEERERESEQVWEWYVTCTGRQITLSIPFGRSAWEID